MRRFTLLTHAFSKKWEHHAAMVALYFQYDHCARVPQTLRIILAMEARIADHVWSIEDIDADPNTHAVGDRATNRHPRSLRGLRHGTPVRPDQCAPSRT